MVTPIVSNPAVPHNHVHSSSVEAYLRAYDRLFVHIGRIRSLTVFALALEVEHYGGLDSEHIYNYFCSLDDHAEEIDAALKDMDMLQKFLIHSYCGCDPTQPSL